MITYCVSRIFFVFFSPNCLANKKTNSVSRFLFTKLFSSFISKSFLVSWVTQVKNQEQPNYCRGWRIEKTSRWKPPWISYFSGARI